MVERYQTCLILMLRRYISSFEKLWFKQVGKGGRLQEVRCLLFAISTC